MNEHEKYTQMTVRINFLFCFLLHLKDDVNEVIILDGCMSFIKRPTMMCLADRNCFVIADCPVSEIRVNSCGLLSL